VTIPEATRSGSSRRAEPAARRSLPLWPPPRDGWIAIAGVALLYAAHWFYGALVSDVALVMNIAAAALVGAALLSPRLRAEILRLKGLTLPAVLFGLVILVALWTLTPWTPGGPHPVWAYVGVTPGASTLDKSATLIEIIKLLGLACLFVVGLAAGARDDRARYAVQLTIVAGVVFGFWAFLLSVSGDAYATGGRRLEAHFLNPIRRLPARHPRQGGVRQDAAAGEPRLRAARAGDRPRQVPARPRGRLAAGEGRRDPRRRRDAVRRAEGARARPHHVFHGVRGG
jgi:hypothetical protein